MTEGVPTPRSTGKLQKLVRQYVRERGLAEGRVRAWVSYMALAGALERAKEDGLAGPHFTMRGGVAMELRLKGKSRATRDMDLTYTGPDEDLVGAMDDAIRAGYRPFTFRRSGQPHEMTEARTVRLEIAVSYNGGPWGTVVVDVSHPEGHQMEVELVPAFDLSVFGIEGPQHLTCLSARYHLAHKIHGMSRPPEDGNPNERVQDAVDALLLRELVPDLAAAGEACVEVFSTRGTHPWPPVFQPPEAWAGRYRQLARELEMETDDLNVAAAELRDYIIEIGRAAPRNGV